ncbi:MAG: hypothetical protein ACRC50_07745 [Gaiella sp.]
MSTADGARLAEIPEEAARGRTAELYEDIRRVTGVGSVVLVYRALAAHGDALEIAWSDLAPNLADDRARAAALGLGADGDTDDVAVLPPSLVRVPLDRAAETLATFARANRLNVVALSALLDGVDRPPAATPAASAREVVPTGLPMADLARLPPATLTLLEEMSAPVAGGERPVVIPSLYRFFAHDEQLLRALWDAIRPTVENPAFASRVAGLQDDGRALGARLPYRVRALPPGEPRVIVERFLRTIPSMIVVGALLARALGIDPRSLS